MKMKEMTLSWTLIIIILIALGLSSCDEPERTANGDGWFMAGEPNIPEDYICVPVEDLAEVFE